MARLADDRRLVVHERDQVDANTEFLTETGLNVGDQLTTRIAGQVYDPNRPSLWTSRQTLGRVAGLGVYSCRIGVQPGVSPQRYAAAHSRRLDLGG